MMSFKTVLRVTKTLISDIFIMETPHIIRGIGETSLSEMHKTLII